MLSISGINSKILTYIRLPKPIIDLFTFHMYIQMQKPKVMASRHKFLSTG